MKKEALFGAGCFWGVEEVFRTTPGVLKTEVGYAGGDKENPTYEEVCRGNTGHIEVVHIEYDEEQISYEKLLELFFANHNPTTWNRQGPDVGEQYRSVIFFYSPLEEKQARMYVEELKTKKVYKDEVVTLVLPFKNFYRAEEYHQEYLSKKGLNVCH